MPPQTRSAKPTPGRSTRNSVYGRPPPSSPKPSKNSTTSAPAQTPKPHGQEVEVKSNVSNTTNIPWLACRDPYGILTSIAMSKTGEGVHIRWYYPDEDCEVDEDEGVVVQMTVDEERGVTPPITAGPCSAFRRLFPQTPMALHSFNAGSVIRTPVKKAKPLQPSPPRIGDKGIRCLYEKGGVLRELNGGARVVLHHPVGSTANLTREQVERLEDEREERIVRIQVKKLLDQKRQMEKEEACFSDSGYEGEMDMDIPSFQSGLQRERTNDTILISHDESSDIVPTLEEIESALGFSRGPNGELLDHHGRQLFGPEGTILVDSNYGSPRRIKREKAFLMSVESVDYPSPNEPRRARFGPQGTELID